MKRITDEQRHDFETNGFLQLKAQFTSSEMDGLLRFAKSDIDLKKQSRSRKDAEGTESRLTVRNDLNEDCVYSAIVRSPRIAGTMEQLLQDEVYHYHHKMMLKEPRVGGAWEWHQDYGYWYDFGCLFPDMASCLIAVDRATPANGCLQVLSGSHKMGRINHHPVGGQVGADPDRVEVAKQHFELHECVMNPGDALFFHSNLLHRSDRNRSDEPRWSLICCYNTKHNDPFVTDGRHPNYAPLELWTEQRVTEVLQQFR